MKMELIGHACAWFADDAGRRILTDPCRPGALSGRVWTAKPPPADIVTVSHYHEDHGWIGAVEGAPTIIDQSRTAHGIDIEFTASCHDHDGGCIAGLNHMCRFTLDGVTVLHPGDLGELPSVDDCAAMHGVDLLLLPVGGKYTLSPEDAVTFAERLAPRWVVPIHYRTPDVNLPMAPAEVFLERWRGDVHITESNRWSPDSASGVWYLRPPKAPRPA